jgi:hypothetical protein
VVKARKTLSGLAASTRCRRTVLVEGFADSWAILVSFDVSSQLTRGPHRQGRACGPPADNRRKKICISAGTECRGSNAAASARSPVPAAHLRIPSPATILVRRDLRDTACFSALEDRLLKSWPQLQIAVMQLAREGSPPPSLAYLRRSRHGIPIR